MEFHEIRYFLAVSRARDVMRAAEFCNVSQPALTRAMHKMEDELGAALFVREGSNVHLTPLGRLLEPHLHDALLRSEAGQAAPAPFLRQSGAPLSVGVMSSIGPQRFVSFLGRFRSDHPDIQLALHEATAGRLTERLLQGGLDAALIARPEGFVAPFQASALYSERFVIACAAGHAFSRKQVVRLSELDGQPYLVRANCEYRDVLRETCRANGAQPAEVFSSERDDWIQIMVAAGLGISVLPEFSATVPGVIVRPLMAPEIARQVALVTLAGRPGPPELTAFAQAVQRYRWPEQAG